MNEDGTTKPLDPRGVPGKSASTGAASALAAAAGKIGSSKQNTASASSSTSTARMSTGHRGASAEGALSTSSTTLALTTTPDIQPLFYRAAKTTGFLTPITGSCTPQRLNAFRNVGRFYFNDIFTINYLIILQIDWNLPPTNGNIPAPSMSSRFQIHFGPAHHLV